MSDDLIANGEKDGARHAGPVLLFVHGFLDSGEVWTRLRQELSGKGLATATLDLRGHGTRTDEPGELSLDAFARDVVAIIDHLDREIILVGQSMGAQIAELAAVSRPDRVSGLVLLTPIPLGGVNAPEEAMAPFKELGGSAERQIQQRQALSHAIGRDDLAWLGGVGASVAPEVVREVAEVWNRGHEAGARPSAYSGPTLVVRGVSDPFVDGAMIERVVSRFRDSMQADIADAGHWAHVEQPGRLAVLLSTFAYSTGARARSGAAVDWTGAFAERSASSFGDALASDVVLEASVLVKPLRGRDLVKRVMEAASQVYASLSFMDSTTAGAKQYVEWEAAAHEGVAFRGVTILTRDAEGRIAHVAIHHRPMEAAIFFSKTLGRRLKDVVPPGHFLDTAAETQLQERT